MSKIIISLNPPEANKSLFRKRGLKRLPPPFLKGGSGGISDLGKHGGNIKQNGVI